MADYRRNEIVSGLFIVLSVLVFAAFTLKTYGRPIPFFESKGVECEAWFSDVGQLDSAAKVSSFGHRVGTVSSIEQDVAAFTAAELDEEKKRLDAPLPEGWKPGRRHHMVRVRFKITDQHVRLGEDASVSVVQEGFIGPWYLALDPGTWDEADPPPLVSDRKDPGPIQVKPRRTETLRDLVPAVKPVLRNIDSILVRIDEDLLRPLLEGKQEDLARIVPDLRAAITEAQKGIGDVRALVDPNAEDSPVRRMNKLLDDTDRSVLELKDQLTKEVLPPLKQAIEDGKSALASAKKAMESASGLIDENKPKVNELLENLRAESARLDARLSDVQKRLGTLLDDADHLASLRQADLAVIIEAFRNTAWEIEQAARKVRANPAVLLFGDDEDQRLEAEPRDDTGLRKRGRVKPYEQRDESPTRKE